MKKTIRFTALLLAMMSIFSLFGGMAFADVEEADVQEKERSADILKRQLIGFNSDSNTLSVYKAMYNNILTPADSPLTVTEVCYLSEPVYYIEANTEADSMSYLRYISNKMDNKLTGGGFAYMEFCAVVEDCLGIVGVEVKAEAVDKEASAQQAWVSALFVEDENAPGWMMVGEYEYVDGQPAEANYIGDILGGEGCDVSAILVAPTNGMQMYSEKGFMISYGFGNAALIVGTEEAARNYLSSVGLEEYLW